MLHPRKSVKHFVNCPLFCIQTKVMQRMQMYNSEISSPSMKFSKIHQNDKSKFQNFLKEISAGFQMNLWFDFWQKVRQGAERWYAGLEVGTLLLPALPENGLGRNGWIGFCHFYHRTVHCFVGCLCWKEIHGCKYDISSSSENRDFVVVDQIFGWSK